MDTVQADDAGACPTGYTACSSGSSNRYDVYCVAEADYPAKCPILSIDILSNIDAQADLYDANGWNKQTFTQSHDLYYT